MSSRHAFNREMEEPPILSWLASDCPVWMRDLGWIVGARNSSQRCNARALISWWW